MNKDELFNYKDKWFVLMHESLYGEDQNLIGFRDEREWELILIGSLVVYYQFGAQYLRGIYEVAETGQLINPKYGRQFNKDELRCQCKLKRIYSLPRPFTQYHARNLSFYKDLHNYKRWDNRRVFEINDNDLKFILSLA
jgi:hypothetical protein